MNVSLVVAALAGATAAGEAAHVSRPELALVGGTVYVDPAREPIRDAVVLIRSGSIAAVAGPI